ncbi:MAG: hypothetical protein J6X33_04450 [Clostridiales bacterium]|nr:hypothetical protein [Clostridiales bacterium]
MKKTLVSAVLLAAIALTACNADTPAATSATEESTTETTTAAVETSESSEATEESKDTEAPADDGFAKYKDITDAIKTIVDTKDVGGFGDYGECVGILETAQLSEDPMAALKYELIDIDNNGTDELFVISDEETKVENGSYHTIFVLGVYTVDGDGKIIPVTAGWARNRLQYMKDGTFYRTGSGSANTVVVEFQKYFPDKNTVESYECYYTTGETDSDGNMIMYKAKDPAAPAFDGSDENVGPYEEFQIADDIYTFDNAVSFADFYGKN